MYELALRTPLGVLGTLIGSMGLASVAQAKPIGSVSGPLHDRPQEGEAGSALVIHAERVIVRPGKELEDVSVLVQEGKIVALGKDLAVPEGAQEIAGEVVCAGFIDGWSGFAVEGRSLGDNRTSAASRSVDALDPFVDARYREQILRAGVTSYRTQVGNGAAVGGLGAAVRVAGGDDAVLLEDCGVGFSLDLASNGREPDLFARVDQVDRLTRMLNDGVSYEIALNEYEVELAEWEAKIAEEEAELEKDFKKAKKNREKEIEEAEEKEKEFKEERYKEDKKPSAPRFDADKAVAARVASGEIPLFVRADRAVTLRAFLAGTERFGRARFVIVGGAQAERHAKELAERRIPVIVHPMPQGEGSSGPSDNDPGLAGRLRAQGVRVLLGSGGATGVASRDLPLLASLAVGHGLDRQDAFAALTVGAAHAFDLGDRLGSVEAGKDADLLILDGEPLASDTSVRYVVSGGDVVLNPED